MHLIEKSGTEFKIKHYLWNNNDYEPETSVTIGYDDGGYKVHFVSYETDLKCVQTEHNTEIFKDSCMEMFMQFAPETDERYINFEINPNAAVYCSAAKDRYNYEKVAPEVIDTLGVKTKIYDDRWEIDFYLTKEYIKNLIPTYEHKEGIPLRGNFYKCGDKERFPHHGCFNKIEWEKPDFHRPEFFAEFKLA